MAVKKINYMAKVSVTSTPLPVANKVMSEDMNEIKTVVNNNADELSTTISGIAAIKSDVSSLNGKISSPSATFNIRPDDWQVGGMYTFSDPRITPTSYQEVICTTPSSSLTGEQKKSILSLGLFFEAQGNGYMIVQYTNKPTVEIPLTVIFRGVK